MFVKNYLKVLSLVSVLLMVVISAAWAGGSSEKGAEAAAGPGPVTVKWAESITPDGWVKVTNEGGATLGYSPNSKLQIIQADGYAFKDLNNNGKLDQFEDWRLDYDTRARSLAGELSVEQMMAMKMNPHNSGAPNATELADITKMHLETGYRAIGQRATTAAVEVSAAWNNLVQEYIEGLGGIVIPAVFQSDPRGRGTDTSSPYWPSHLGIAASFDPEVAAEYGRVLSEEWRALGISMKIAPQMDLATDPRWKRNDMTFGEDPALSMDIARAMVNAWQSTYDEDGNDLGWGEHSVNCQIKHVTGDGAGEGGRESHTLDGAYNVFPGGQFYTHILPFAACLDLPGKTETVSATMTNFSVSIDADGSAIGNERTATGFNIFKTQTLWRDAYGFDGHILTDFGIITGKPFGVEHLTEVERVLLVMLAGNDGFGGDGNYERAMEAYQLGVERHGEAFMLDLMRVSAVRTLKVILNVGMVENPYLSLQHALETVSSEENIAAGHAASVKSVVMLKNSGNLIKPAPAQKQTVYIPWKYFPATTGRNAMPASIAPTFELETASQYFTIVTDKPAEVRTGPNDSAGRPTWSENDIIRASAAEIAACDFALVRIQNPRNGNPTKTTYAQEGYIYRPISLQYRPYTADGRYVRLESLGGDLMKVEVEGTYDTEIITVKENRSYYGQTAIISNEGDLDHVLYAASVADKVVVAANVYNSMIFSEFEKEVDSILVTFSGDRGPAVKDAALLDIISGRAEPSGLLPLQMPRDMDDVERQFEDTPRDMDCYVDSAGNKYDFAFGLNWSGRIRDARTRKYDVPPIVGKSPF